ncbi:CopG family transcriptional regulator [Arthrobacter livingstonensis]|uniref:CopG family transcriptional regulator n=1 Tax=Arthrobacter livingstonensis TaxID=670078 RepID=A0A2V5L683_9MICC|nr:ribbon-helix-helix protein, CopG family [Arthrobacter livingstonensis]PYI66698.1 CopG family transcriptional regulator [Arthrobacter livingstonensis]
MTISIRLTAEEEARLDGLARRTGRSKSFYVRTALHAYLADLEDAFAADSAIEDFESGGRRSRPLAALKAETER